MPNNSGKSLLEGYDFLDANVIIYAFSKHSPEQQAASRALLKDLNEGKVQLLTNYLAMVEAYYHLQKSLGNKETAKILKQLLKMDCFSIVPIDDFLFWEAVSSAENHSKLSMHDLIHYTTALLYNTSKIYSFDHDFDNLKISRCEPGN